MGGGALYQIMWVAKDVANQKNNIKVIENALMVAEVATALGCFLLNSVANDWLYEWVWLVTLRRRVELEGYSFGFMRSRHDRWRTPVS